jgi:iron(III) transport system substrate-binding protein
LRSAALGLTVAAVGLLDSGGATAHVEELTVATAIQADDLAKYAKRFNNDRPDIKIQRVCNPSAIIAEKLLAEKYHPQRGAIWAGAAYR